MRTLKIHPSDNTAVNLDSGFKIALEDIPCGKNIIKYGFPIGHASRDIKAGETVHTDNIKTNLSSILEYKYSPDIKPLNRPPYADKNRTLSAYRRENGDIGVRNEIWIVPTVGCVNGTARALSERGNAVALTHPFGCSQLGDDHEITRLTLRGLVNHPNAAGVLVLGLGCENNTMDSFKNLLGDYNPNRVKFLVTQNCSDEIEEGLKLLQQLHSYADSFSRSECSISQLKIGLKCGGSDGFSGITANPLVGRFSDAIVSCGASTVLTEVPEMFGAETLLMNRAENEQVFEKTVRMINGYKNYFTAHSQVIYENPSPGNKAGGISTLEDKSLGCTQKSGSAPVCDVLDYGDFITKHGLSLLNGPGNDMVAVTNLTAAGCHMILFTTGRGTPLGAPVPTIKISSNSKLFRNKPNWIDFDAGGAAENSSDEYIKSLDRDFFEFVLSAAEGRQVKNEINGYKDISIFKDGVVL